MSESDHYTARCLSCGKDTAFLDDRLDGVIECIHCGAEIELLNDLESKP
jgi:DNA-directed RNA polymerase subunit RPC12/RpoP